MRSASPNRPTHVYLDATFSTVIERHVPAKQDEDDDANAPHVDLHAVGLLLEDLGCDVSVRVVNRQGQPTGSKEGPIPFIE